METGQSWPTLSELLAPEETQGVEFKASMASMREAFEQLCAMINADTARGAVVFGIDPDGAVVGVDANLDSIQRTLANHAKQKFDPLPRIEIVTPRHEGKSLVVLYARRLPGISFHEYGGRAFVREGSSQRLLSPAEKRLLIIRSEVGRIAQLAAARLAALDRVMIEAWERRGSSGTSTKALQTLETWANELEADFARAAPEEKPIFAPVLREVYWLLLRRAREHYASSSGYQEVKQRVLRGLSAIEQSAEVDK